MDRLTHKFIPSLIWITFALMPFLAIAGGLGIAPTGFLIGLAGWTLIIQNNAVKDVVFTPWFIALLALLFWCLIAQSWSPYPPNGFQSNAVKLIVIVFGYCAIIASFKTLKPDMQNLLCHFFLASSLFGMGLLLIDILSGFGLSILVDPVRDGETLHKRQGDAEQNLGRGILTYTQFLPAIILMFATKFKRGWLTAIPLVFVIVVTAHLNRLSLPLLIILPMLLIMGLTWKFPKPMVKLTFVLIILFIIFGPLSGYASSLVSDEQLASLPLSVEHRLRMWAYAWERILENPIFGNGFDASRSYQDTFISKQGYEITIVSLHTHNVPVQIWLETGLVGAALSVITIAALLKPALHFANTQARASGLTGVLIAVTLFGATTIGAWQYWWWGSAFLALGLLHILPDDVKRGVQPS